MKYLIACSVLILGFIIQVEAQTWEVNPEDYEFSMNVTGKVKVDGDFVNQEDAVLGAFLDDECVGVSSAILNDGDYLFYCLTIYSNQSFGEMISFTWKDSDLVEYSIENQIQFESNRIIGNYDEPFVWMDVADYASADFLDFSHSQMVGNADINTDSKTISILVLFGTDLVNFTPEFVLAPGAEAFVGDVLQLSGESVLDFSNPVVYEVVAVDGTVEEWIVNVNEDENSIATLDATQFSVYPNPSNELVVVKALDKEWIQTIMIYHMDGQLMRSYIVDDFSFKFDVSLLPTGLYTMVLSSDNQVAVKRLVVAPR